MTLGVISLCLQQKYFRLYNNIYNGLLFQLMLFIEKHNNNNKFYSGPVASVYLFGEGSFYFRLFGCMT